MRQTWVSLITFLFSTFERAVKKTRELASCADQTLQFAQLSKTQKDVCEKLRLSLKQIQDVVGPKSELAL